MPDSADRINELSGKVDRLSDTVAKHGVEIDRLRAAGHEQASAIQALIAGNDRIADHLTQQDKQTARLELSINGDGNGTLGLVRKTDAIKYDLKELNTKVTAVQVSVSNWARGWGKLVWILVGAAATAGAGWLFHR